MPAGIKCQPNVRSSMDRNGAPDPLQPFTASSWATAVQRFRSLAGGCPAHGRGSIAVIRSVGRQRTPTTGIQRTADIASADAQPRPTGARPLAASLGLEFTQPTRC